MDLTVCIPSYNDSSNLDNLLESISKNQTDDLDYEIIVCDSDSDDDTEIVIRNWQRFLPIVYKKSFKGASASINLNKGIDLAKGKIFCRIDSHCLVSENYLIHGVKIFRAMQLEYSALGPSVEIQSSKKTRISNSVASLYKSPFLLGPSKFKRSLFFKNFSGRLDTIYLGFYRTADLVSLNGFDEKINRKQDIELLRRLESKTGRGFYNSSDLIITYILKQDTIFTLSARCMEQGSLLFESIKSSRPIHFAPIITIISFLGLVWFSYKIAITLVICYLFASVIFGLIESRSISTVLVSIILFPLVHLAYVFGNLSGIVSKKKSL